MHQELARLLRQNGGVVRRDEVTPTWMLTNAAKAGRVTRVFPSTYVDTALADRPHTRRRAALRYLGGRAVLSHTTALAVWRIGWDGPVQGPVHLTVAADVHVRGARDLVVHRRIGFDPREQAGRGGFPVTPLPATLVDSWPLLPGQDRIGVVIGAVTRGHVAIAAVREALARAPKMTGAAGLARLLDLLAAGCHSPLELWGALHVFTGPGMPAFRRQHRIGRYHVDLFAEAERVAFELDGAAFHGTRVQREHDLRRDAFLATQGVQVVHFTYSRLMSEPDSVRSEVRAILKSAVRRRA